SLDEDVIALALEDGVLLDVEHDVEVPRPRAVGAGLALAGQPQLGSLVHPRGDLDGQRALGAHATLAPAGRARLHDAAAGPTAHVARTRHREEALLEGDLAAPAALPARLDAVLPLRSLAAAVLAALQPRHADPSLETARSLLELDREVVAEVLAAPRPLPAASAEDAPEPEDVAEDVAEVGEDLLVEPGGLRAEASAAEAVVTRALLVVREDGVRLRRLLELVLGRLVARVLVGVVPDRETAIRLLDLRRVGVALDAEHLVVVDL